MCAPVGDGACAIVLRGATASAQGPVLSGVGYDLEPHALGDRDLMHWHGLERALRRACKTAGLEREHAHFDVAEPSCLFAYEEELFIAAAGLGDHTAVSLDGGLLAGCVPVVAGMSRLAAAARQLRGAEGCDRRALAHGTWGPAAQGQIVAILEGASL
jgi:acetyl-CoA acetyltransferase